MYTEELVEEGIVTEVKDGLATISVMESTSCDDCSAKIFCHTENNIKSVTAKDFYGVKPGDTVRISIKGRNLVTASVILYGVPLLLIVAGIVIGFYFSANNSEIISSVLGFIFLGVYLVTLYFALNSNRMKNKFLPTIISSNNVK